MNHKIDTTKGNDQWDPAGINLEGAKNKSHSRLRTWLARMVIWLIDPVLNPILMSLGVVQNQHSTDLVDIYKVLKIHVKELSAIQDELAANTVDRGNIKEKQTGHHGRLDELRSMQNRLVQALGLYEHPMDDEVWISETMDKFRTQFSRHEAKIKLNKKQADEVPAISNFLTMMMKKMDWKIDDGGRSDNHESWRCGLLDTMNRSSMAMERLLGLELADEAINDKLEEFQKVQAVALLLSEQRMKDVNEFLMWKRKVNDHIKDHSERLHNLDDMHNLPVD